MDIEKEREQEENERKKAYLRRYLNAKRKQELIETEIDELRIKQMTPSGLKQDGMPRGSNYGGDLSEYAAQLDELDKELKHQLCEKLRIRKEIVEKIESMKDETEGLVLRMRYIHGMKMYQIADKIECEERTAYRIFKRALQNIKIF